MDFSLRIVNADFYTSSPLPGFDSVFSDFRSSKTAKVPVIRIFGSTPNGQKTCLHIHGVLPYIYVPYNGDQPTDKYLQQFATSVDFALHVSQGKASSSTRHVHDIQIVTGRSFYGYHEEEQEFMKVSFYNPYVVTRVVDLLQSGAVMNKSFQPYEAHIPYIQQFFIDYNLYGMNLLNASSFLFRRPLQLTQDHSVHITQEGMQHSPILPVLSPSSDTGSQKHKFWTNDTVPRHSLHDPSVERLSICELEVDIKSEHILNQFEIESNVRSIGTNPGLLAIWEDERQRREDENDVTDLGPPVSQDRGDLPLLEAEKRYKQRLQQIIADRGLLFQGQQQTQFSQKQTDLRKEEEIFPSPVDFDTPIVDQSIVQEVVASQMSLSQQLVNNTDLEMVEILASLAADASQSCAGSQSVLADPELPDHYDESEVKQTPREEDEEESILMSQQVWDDTDPAHSEWPCSDDDVGDNDGDGDGDDDSDDADKVKDDKITPESPLRFSQFDFEGLDDSWKVSLLEEDLIPQLDGTNDDLKDNSSFNTITSNKVTKHKKNIKKSDQCSRKKEKLSLKSESVDCISYSRQSNEKRKPNRRLGMSAMRLTKRLKSSESNLKTTIISESISETVPSPRKPITRQKSLLKNGSPFKLHLSESSSSGEDDDQHLQKNLNSSLSGRKSFDDLHAASLPPTDVKPSITYISDVDIANVKINKKHQNTMTKERKQCEDESSNYIEFKDNFGKNTKEISTPGSKGKSYKDIKRKVFAGYSNKISKIKNTLKSNKSVFSIQQNSIIKPFNIKPAKDLKSCENKGKDSLSTEPLPNLFPALSLTRDTKIKNPKMTRYKNGIEKRPDNPMSDLKQVSKRDITASQDIQNDENFTKLNPQIQAHPMKDMKIVLNDVANSEVNRHIFMAALERWKRLETNAQNIENVLSTDMLGKPSFQLTSDISSSRRSSSGKSSSINTAHRRSSSKRLCKQANVLQKSPKRMRYGMLNVTVHTSPPPKTVSTPPPSRCPSKTSPKLCVKRNILTQITKSSQEEKSSGTEIDQLLDNLSTCFLKENSRYDKTSSEKLSDEQNVQTGSLVSKTEKNVSAKDVDHKCNEQLIIDSRVLDNNLEPAQLIKNQESNSKRLNIDKRLRLSLKRRCKSDSKSCRALQNHTKNDNIVGKDQEEFVGKDTPLSLSTDSPSIVAEISTTDCKIPSCAAEQKRELSTQESCVGSENEEVRSLPCSPDESNCSMPHHVTNTNMSSDPGDDVIEISTHHTASLQKNDDIKQCKNETQLANLSNVTRKKSEIHDSFSDDSQEYLKRGDEGDFTALMDSDCDLFDNALFNMSYMSPEHPEDMPSSPPLPCTPGETPSDNHHEDASSIGCDIQHCGASEVNTTRYTTIPESQDNATKHTAIPESQVNTTNHTAIPARQVNTTSHAALPARQVNTTVNTAVPEDQVNFTKCATIPAGQVSSIGCTTIPVSSVNTTKLTTIATGQVNTTEHTTIASAEVSTTKHTTITAFLPELKYLSDKNCSFEGTNEQMGSQTVGITHLKSLKTTEDQPTHFSRNSSSEATVDRTCTTVSKSSTCESKDSLLGAIKKSDSITLQRPEHLQLSTTQKGFPDFQKSKYKYKEDYKNSKESYSHTKQSKNLKSSLSILHQYCVQLEQTKMSLMGVYQEETEKLSIENDSLSKDSVEEKITSKDETDEPIDNIASSNSGPLFSPNQSGTDSMQLSQENKPPSDVEEFQSAQSDNDLGSMWLPHHGSSVIMPSRKAPSSIEITQSLGQHGLPKCRYQKPFYDDPNDVPENTMDVGGRLLKIQSKEIKNLHDFDTKSPFVGLHDWRQLLGANHDTSFLKACQENIGSTETFLTGIENNPSLRTLFMGDKPLIITPCRPPPNLSTVKKWALEKFQKKSQTSIKDCKKVTNHAEGQSNDKVKSQNKKLQSTKQDRNFTKLNLDSRTGKQPHGNVQTTSVPKPNDFPCNQDEITSPDSLFSPVGEKTFSFEIKLHSRRTSDGDNGEHEEQQHKQFLNEYPISNKVNPVELKGAGNLQNVPFQSTPFTQSKIKIQHASSSPSPSTPMSKRNLPLLPFITPITASTQQHSLPEEKSKDSSNCDSQKNFIESRRQLKLGTPDVHPLRRRLTEAGSDIEGPSPINTAGYKVPQLNIQDAKASHEVQHLTLMSIELHVRTRKDRRPDPEFDPICALFYHAQTDSPCPGGENKITGIICVDKYSANLSIGSESLCRSRELSPDHSKLSRSAVGSTPGPNRRTLLERSGITQYHVKYVEEEKELFNAFLFLVRKWDPDILIGYEIQMLSWGYLIQRALVFDLDLGKLLSRVTGSSSDSNIDAEKDLYGAAHTSEIKIGGRIILNVWRLMRHEAALNIYTFENVVFHILHERIPLFTFRSLSDWWDHKTDLYRWRTVQHYVTRCHGNIRLLEHVDFIGRTSELARVFGILFYCVISRGSQFRVESMMLRMLRPMKYMALSPSVQQRNSMNAPEVIALVMEPESRFYCNPVLVLDFQSLYPSMVIAYNYCYSTCLGRVSCIDDGGEFKFGASTLSVPPHLLKKLEDDIHISPNGVAFVKSNVRRGILPKMLDDILTTRVMVKNSMKKWKNKKAVHRMLDARQLGLKLIANVTYGYTAAHFSGRMPCVEIGDSIVRKARETLEHSIYIVNNTKKWNAKVVYGDTDSMFVLLDGVSKDEAFRIGKDIADTITAMNPKPVKLKFEKVYLPCVLQTKKRYVGYMYETADQKEPIFDAKGIETVRRDTCPAVAKVLEKSLRLIFETKDVSLVKRFVQRQFRKVLEGRISLQDLIFAKEYRGMSSYKPGSCVPALELTKQMLKEDRRSEPRVGERVPYVIVYGSPGLPLIRLVRRPHEVLQDPSLRINALYYITKQLIPPLNRAFMLMGVDVKSWFAEVPRNARVKVQPLPSTDTKKKTISHYFTTTSCPVCQQTTSKDLCDKCAKDPQKVAVTINQQIREYERKHRNLSEICYHCCGSRDPKLQCVSLDCPVFHKLVKATRNLNPSQQLRRILADHCIEDLP